MPSQYPKLVYGVGQWEIDLGRRELRSRGVPVAIGGRAFEIIEVLVQSAGQLLTKDELIGQVWPGAFVEENTLQVHISAVRKALGADRGLLKTVSGRGYRLLGNWTIQSESASSVSVDPPPVPFLAPLGTSNLPLFGSELIGRTGALQQIRDLISAYRLVTLTGPGGIGKTRLGLEVARDSLPRFQHGCWLVELASLSDPGLVPSAVAASLGLEVRGAEISAVSVARAIGAQQRLLMLDNCEHVIEAAARLAEAVMRMCAGVSILVTSREVLRIDSEHAYHVPPLTVPIADQRESRAILEHSAVQLFTARMQVYESDFVSNPEVLGAICRHLDGIPLAIELAAAQAVALGPETVLARLDDRFSLLTAGRRTALPRHQTLRATLDWSYELLTETERVLLRRLAIFAGSFTLEAAGAVAALAGPAAQRITAAEILDGIVSLVGKSLVAVNRSDRTAYYGLLETTRAYARTKLTDSGELEQVARRHAEYLRDLFDKAQAEADATPTAEWLAKYGRWIDNVRAALDWTFSPNGDAAIGVALTVGSVRLWTQWSLLAECRGRVERALATTSPTSRQDAHFRMQLYAALGASLTYTSGPVPETGEAWNSALAIAEELDDVGYQLQVLRGLWIYRLSRGECRPGLLLAQRFSGLTERTGDPADRLVAERMTGVSLHYLGELSRARHHIEQALRGPPVPVQTSHATRLLLDQQITARALLARTYWLQGFPVLAMQAAGDVVTDAQAMEHGLPLCHALAQAACPIALLAGDLAAAELWVNLLVDHTAKHRLAGWLARGQCFRGILLIMRGDFAAGLPLLRDALEVLRKTGLVMYFTAFLGELAHALGQSGAAEEALATIDEALQRSERDEERWCVAELLRIRGELLAPRHAADAERHFRQALGWARPQGARSWELRAAISLVRLQPPQHRVREARALLAPIYERFTEGFATADLLAASALLAHDARPTIVTG